MSIHVFVERDGNPGNRKQVSTCLYLADVNIAQIFWLMIWVTLMTLSTENTEYVELLV